MSNKKELHWSTRLLEDLLGSCTKFILNALRVPDANSLMCKFFLGLNEIIVVSKSFTGEHKTHAKVRSQMCCNDNKMYDEKTDKKLLIKHKQTICLLAPITP